MFGRGLLRRMGLGEDAEASGATPHRSAATPGLKSTTLRRLLASIGPGFLVSVGYMDPGNWATNIAAGSRFSYTLLWVLLASNLMAILLQTLSAKLGIATGLSLAANCREHFSRPVSFGLWLTAEAACMATDLAEVLGAALGLYILFGLPMFYSALLTGVLVMMLLALNRFGYRRFEAVIFAMIIVIGGAYIFEVYLARPDWSQIVYHTFTPQLSPDALLVAVGMLGATVMPHNLFLHSQVIMTRLGTGEPRRRILRFSFIDTALALNSAFFINAAMVVMAAAVFYQAGIAVESIEQAHQTLTPLLGSASSFVFAVALLAAGLSSAVTGTQAGQAVMEGFVRIRMSAFARRAITLVPALVVIALGVDSLKALIVSQVILSLQLPFTILPLIWLTRRREVMGEFVNRRLTNWLAFGVAAIIITLNGVLLYQVFFASGS